MLLIPSRHVQSTSELDDTAAAQLGPLLRGCTWPRSEQRVAFTLDTYTEDVPELHHEAADLVTNLFFNDPIDET